MRSARRCGVADGRPQSSTDFMLDGANGAEHARVSLSLAVSRTRYNNVQVARQMRCARFRQRVHPTTSARARFRFRKDYAHKHARPTVRARAMRRGVRRGMRFTEQRANAENATQFYELGDF